MFYNTVAFVSTQLSVAMPYVWKEPDSWSGSRHRWRGSWEPLSSQRWAEERDGEWKFVQRKKTKKAEASSQPPARPASSTPSTSPASAQAEQKKHRTFLQVVLDADTEAEISAKKELQEKRVAASSQKEARAERIRRALEALGEEDAESDIRRVLLEDADKSQVSSSEKKKRAELDAKKAYCERENARLLELNASIAKAQKALELRNAAVLEEMKTVEALEKRLSLAQLPPPQLEKEVELLRMFLCQGLAHESPDWTVAAKSVKEQIDKMLAEAEEPSRKKPKPGTADGGGVPS